MKNNFNLARATLTKHFVNEWSASAPVKLPLAAVEMPNKKLDRGLAKDFARLSIVFSRRENAAIGAAKIRLRGFLFLQVFSPEGTGIKIITDAGDNFANIFDNKTLKLNTSSSPVICSAVDPAATGNRDGYEQGTYSLPFYIDADS